MRMREDTHADVASRGFDVDTGGPCGTMIALLPTHLGEEMP
jgi:hypothetical protein